MTLLLWLSKNWARDFCVRDFWLRLQGGTGVFLGMIVRPLWVVLVFCCYCFLLEWKYHYRVLLLIGVWQLSEPYYRIIGIGDVDFSSSGSAGIEVVFKGVSKPMAVMKKIQNTYDMPAKKTAEREVAQTACLEEVLSEGTRTFLPQVPVLSLQKPHQGLRLR